MIVAQGRDDSELGAIVPFSFSMQFYVAKAPM